MVLIGSYPCPGSWSRTHGAHLQLQAREDPKPTPVAVPSTLFLSAWSLASFTDIMDIVSFKQSLRRDAESARPAMKEDNPQAHAAMARNFFDAVPVAPGSRVSTYVAMRSEADPSLLVEEARTRGAVILLPRVQKNMPLHFHHWEKDAPLVPAAFGLKEPAREWPQEDPDILIVPLLAFDASGHRLGYGGGYYDRTLQALRAKKTVIAVGLAFSGQQRDDLLNEPHDQTLDFVVTEKRALRFSRDV
jgi:5-formyltetrahydrofolate cyclo-ligase